MAKQYQSCDSLRIELEEGVRMAAKVLGVEDSLIKIQRQQIDLRDQSAKIQTDRILNQQAENQVLRKEVRRQRRQKIIAIIAGAGLTILALL